MIDEKIRDLSNNNINNNNQIRDNESFSPVLNLSKSCTNPIEDNQSQLSCESDDVKNHQETAPKDNDNDNDDDDEDITDDEAEDSTTQEPVSEFNDDNNIGKLYHSCSYHKL